MAPSSNEDIRREAFFYLQMGLPIIPLCPSDHRKMPNSHREVCQAPGKSPVLREWAQRGTPSTEEVTEWFRANEYINIGLVLGNTGNWNLAGIDIDGEIGEELLEEWSKGVLPDTWEFTTGNGRRLLYLLPEGSESKKFSKKKENVEGELALLASGQQTVLPPSIHHTGRIYTWTEGRSPRDIDLADAPQWLLNRVLLYKEDQGNTLNLLSDVPPPTVSQEDWTKNVETGERNNHLVKLAGSLIARRNIPKEQILEFLKTWNTNHCVPPLPDSEIEIMVENLFESEQIKAAKYQSRKGKSRSTLRPAPFARAFVTKQEKKGTNWKYCVNKGIFYRCDSLVGPWEIADILYLQKEVRRELIAQDNAWDSIHYVNEVVAALREYLADPAHDDLFDIGLNADVDHIYVGNGILNWRKSELLPWDPLSYSTIKLPMQWDPEALNKDIMDLWLNVLEQWIPDEGARSFLQEFIGYSLIPDCSFRTGVFLFGAGSNGKSLFLDVVSRMFEGYISFVPLHWIAERFETVKLMDKLINVCGDIDSKYMKETSTLKALIAGDAVRGEYKHGRSFHFYPVTRLIFSANVLPKSSDKSEGWYSRWKFVEFPNRFKTDPVFKRDLLAVMDTPEALSTLLIWAIEGLQRLFTRGYFTTSGTMEKSELQYRTENDTVQAFTQYAIKTCPHAGDKTTLSIPSIYGVYKVWCEDVGVKAVSQIEFSRRCQSLDIAKGVRTVNNLSSNCLLGVMFSQEAVDAGLEEEYGFNEAVRSSMRRRK